MSPELYEILSSLSKDKELLINSGALQNDSPEYKELQEKRFTSKDLRGITYRTINYWNEKGFLIGFKDRFEGWRKFSFPELLWIEVLDQLRQLGISLEKTVPLLFKHLGYLPVEDISKFSDLPDEEKRMRGNYTQLMSNFMTYVLYIIFLKIPVSFRIYPDGTCKIHKGIKGYLKTDRLNEELANQDATFINISLTEIIKNYIAIGIEQNIDIEFLNENENELLKHLRNKQVKEIKIRLENGKPLLLEVTDKMNQADAAKRVAEYILTPYENISFKTNGNKTIGFERTTKIKLK